MNDMKMKYCPKEVYYENRDGVNYIILDYGDSKVEHVVLAQPAPNPAWRCARCGTKDPEQHKEFCPRNR